MCKVCKMDQYWKNLIEDLLRNRGHRTGYISRPLKITQIVYVVWRSQGIKISRDTLYKHYNICMGKPTKLVKPRSKKYIDSNLVCKVENHS